MRTTLVLIGGLALGIGVVAPFVGLPERGLWVSALVYLLLGAGLLRMALLEKSARVRALLAENPRVRWGAGLALPPLLILLGSLLVRHRLPSSLATALVLVACAGMAVLFYDMP